jgi:hypothetical protein
MQTRMSSFVILCREGVHGVCDLRVTPDSTTKPRRSGLRRAARQDGLVLVLTAPLYSGSPPLNGSGTDGSWAVAQG